ncbi:MAG: TonB family protein [Burkholderiales bacterium]
MAAGALDRARAALTDPSRVLQWALAASILVHGGLIAAHFGGVTGGQPVASTPALYATLQAASTPSEAVTPALVAAAAPVAVPQADPVPASSEPAPPPVRVAKVRGTATPTGSAFAIPSVPARVLNDRNRLGELDARMGVEFPIEIDQPVRMREPILARYPAAALAQGREDTVGVWVLVNAEGVAEEVQVLDGSPEFAAEVVAAVNAATFVPAENRLHKIRFPLALEFEFRASAGTSVATAAPATTAH